MQVFEPPFGVSIYTACEQAADKFTGTPLYMKFNDITITIDTSNWRCLCDQYFTKVRIRENAQEKATEDSRRAEVIQEMMTLTMGSPAELHMLMVIRYLTEVKYITKDVLGPIIQGLP